MTKTIDGTDDLAAKTVRDQKIKWNFIFFFVTGFVSFLSMFVISKSGIDDFTKFLVVLTIISVFFFVALYLIARIFYLCFKEA